MLISYTCNGYAQSHPEIHKTPVRVAYSGCKFVPFTWANGSHKISFGPHNYLKSVFTEKLNSKILQYIQGTIGIQILVNPSGEACCRSVFDKKGSISVEQLKELQVDQIVDALQNCVIGNPVSPGIKGGNYCIVIELKVYEDGEIEVVESYPRRKFIASG